MTYGKPEINFRTLAIGVILLFLAISYFMNGANLLSQWMINSGITNQINAFVANLIFG